MSPGCWMVKLPDPVYPTVGANCGVRNTILSLTALTGKENNWTEVMKLAGPLVAS